MAYTANIPNIPNKDLNGNPISYDFALDPFHAPPLYQAKTPLKKAKVALRKVNVSPIIKAKNAFSDLKEKKGSTISRAVEALKQVKNQGYPMMTTQYQSISDRYVIDQICIDEMSITQKKYRAFLMNEVLKKLDINRVIGDKEIFRKIYE